MAGLGKPPIMSDRTPKIGDWRGPPLCPDDAVAVMHRVLADPGTALAEIGPELRSCENSGSQVTPRWRGESRANPSLKWRFWRLGTTTRFRGLYG
jgi:hypothetical protein